MNARILSVCDDGSLEGTRLVGGSGLAILIEADNERVLFDTGRKASHLIHNLGCLGISADSVNRAVLSHGHRCHTEALSGFIQERTAPLAVYAHKDVWKPRAKCIAGLKVNIGTPAVAEDGKAETHHIEGWTQITEHLFALNLPPAPPDPKFRKYDGGTWTDDDMADETALVLMSSDGPVLICGCCHTGILNALGAVKERTGSEAAAVIGGIHLMKTGSRIIDELAARLADDAPVLHLCHCTSPNTKMRLRMTLGLSGVRDFYAGTELCFRL